MVELKYKHELPFPAVTFCNVNPVRKTALKEIETLSKALATSAVKGDENGPLIKKRAARVKRIIWITTTREYDP